MNACCLGVFKTVIRLICRPKGLDSLRRARGQSSSDNVLTTLSEKS